MSKEAIAIKALEALARLGNGEQYGNSTGNVIARTALFEMAEQPAQQEPVGKAFLCDRCLAPFDRSDECPKCKHGSATKRQVYTTPQAPAQQDELAREAGCNAAADEGHRLGVKSTDSLRIVAAYLNAAHGITKGNT